MSIHTLPTSLSPNTNITWSFLTDQEEEVVSAHWLYLGSRRGLLELCREWPMLSDARCVEMDVDTFSAHSGT